MDAHIAPDVDVAPRSVAAAVPVPNVDDPRPDTPAKADPLPG